MTKKCTYAIPDHVLEVLERICGDGGRVWKITAEGVHADDAERYFQEYQMNHAVHASTGNHAGAKMVVFEFRNGVSE